MKRSSQKDLTFYEGDESSELITIPRDQYEFLKKNQYLDPPRMVSMNEIFELDYEMPKQAVVVKNLKWSQIQQSIYILQKAAPRTLDNTFIRQLYKRIYEKMSLNPSFENLVLIDEETPSFQYDDNDQYDENQEIRIEDENPKTINDIVNLNNKQKKDKTVINIQQDDRKVQVLSKNNFKKTRKEDKLKREEILIKTFCSKGYDLKSFAEELSICNLNIDSPLDENPYDFIRKVLKAAFYKLQSFVKQDWKDNTLTLSEEVDIEQILGSMIFCHKRYSPESCLTLFNVIKGLCQMQHDDVTDIQSMKLYQQIGKDVVEVQRKMPTDVKRQSNAPNKSILDGVDLDLANVNKYSITSFEDKQIRSQRQDIIPRRRIKKANQDTQIVSVQKLNSIWNSKLQHDLIFHYKKGKNISEILGIFKNQYPKQSDLFSNVALRSTLHKLLREAIKKLLNIISKYGSKDLPILELNGSREIRFITSNNQGLQSRYLLLDIFQLVKYDQKIVRETIEEINSYISSIRNRQVPIQEDSQDEISVPFTNTKKRSKPIKSEWEIKDDQLYTEIHKNDPKGRKK